MSDVKWKPCPFCGSMDSDQFGGMGEYYRRCMNCGAEGPHASVHDDRPILSWDNRYNESDDEITAA